VQYVTNSNDVKPAIHHFHIDLMNESNSDVWEQKAMVLEELAQSFQGLLSRPPPSAAFLSQHSAPGGGMIVFVNSSKLKDFLLDGFKDNPRFTASLADFERRSNGAHALLSLPPRVK
jgi:hypothetical protein